MGLGKPDAPVFAFVGNRQFLEADFIFVLGVERGRRSLRWRHSRSLVWENPGLTVSPNMWMHCLYIEIMSCPRL